MCADMLEIVKMKRRVSFVCTKQSFNVCFKWTAAALCSLTADATQWTHGPHSWTHSQNSVTYSLWPKGGKTQYDFWQIYSYYFARSETLDYSENRPNVSAPRLQLPVNNKWLKQLGFFPHTMLKRSLASSTITEMTSLKVINPLTTHDNIYMMRNDLRSLLWKSTLDNASEHSHLIWCLTQSYCNKDNTADTKAFDSCGCV